MTSAPRIAHAILPIKGKGPSDWGYSWVPVVGPLIGAVLATLAFKATDAADLIAAISRVEVTAHHLHHRNTD